MSEQCDIRVESHFNDPAEICAVDRNAVAGCATDGSEACDCGKGRAESRHHREQKIKEQNRSERLQSGPSCDLPPPEPDGRASLSPASGVGRLTSTSSGSPGRTRPTGFMGREHGNLTKEASREQTHPFSPPRRGNDQFSRTHAGKICISKASANHPCNPWSCFPNKAVSITSSERTASEHLVDFPDCGAGRPRTGACID